MATPTIKSTYSLDVDTVRELEALARRWNVSKSEALRRAIRAAARQGATEETDALNALDRLQGSLALTQRSARLWREETASERSASSQRSPEKQR